MPTGRIHATGTMKKVYAVITIALFLTTACEHRSLEELVRTAESYEMKGDFKMANVVYDEIIKAYPDYEGAYVNKGVNLSYEDQYKEAIAVYKQGLKVAPESVLLHYNIGLNFNRLQQADSAITYFTSALPYSKKCEPVTQQLVLKVVDPNETFIESSEILYERGLIYYEREEYDKCITDMKECITCGYMFAESHYMVGSCLHYLGNEEEACEEFYIAADYGNVQAQEQLNLRCN